MQSMMKKAMLATSFCGRLFSCWLLLAALSLTAASAGDITGTVFRDFDGDAINDAEEVGVAGIEVEAFDVSGSFGTATTAADGTYTITGGVPGEEVRVEFNIPASLDFLRPGITGTNSDALLSFVTMPADNSNVTVELAVGNPGQHCQADPDFVVNCFVNGDQSGSLDVVVSFPSTASNNTPAPGDEAIESQIGTTWGLAYQRSSGTLFASSFHKRHAGFADGTANGTGAIYAIENPADGLATGTSTFLNLNTLFGSAVAGTNLHPTGSDFDLDAASYAAVGKNSFGDMDISDDELTLWVVNLADRRLYEIPLGTDPANPVAPTLSTEVDRHDLFDLFDCDGDGANDTSGDVDLRPFALAFNDGLVYVGAICTGESTADSADLRALVWSFDPDTDTFTNVLDFAGMTYGRGLNIENCTGGAADWNYWDDAYPGTNQQQVCTFAGDPEISNTQPMLSDLEFDEDGNMYLGIRDRFGDQQGFQIEDPDGDLATGDGYGDLLRATPNGLGGWTISAVEATDGTEFFSDDDWTDTTFVHNETSFGGLALRMGNGEIVYTRMDPLEGPDEGDNDFAGGVRWKSTATGATIDQYEVYDPDDGATNIFGKGNGLGDVEPICEVPPLEIGDRLWCDDGDGVQDPGESGISGVDVTLVCDTDASGVVGDGSDTSATVSTDASGGYLFNASNFTGGIPVATQCELRVNRIDVNGSCGPIAVATTIDASSGTRSDLRDSDGALLTTGVFNEFSDTVGIAFTSGLAGNSDHSLDIGFRPSDGTVTGDLTIQKTSIPPGPLTPGQAFQYQITITNPSLITHTEIELFDDLPPGINYVAGSTSVTGPRRFQVRDRFDSVAFNNQDGRDDWAGDWVEVDGAGLGEAVGNVTIAGGSLLLDDNPNTGGQPSAAREVDLSGFTQASFEFDFTTSGGVDAGDAVVVEVSANGGGTYTTLETITGIVGASVGTRTFDISSFVAANTRVRFRVSNLYGGGNETFGVQDVRIDYSSPAAVTVDNAGGANPQLSDGAPPNLIRPSDGFELDPGESMTLTFSVTVDSPLDPSITGFTCPATVDSAEGLLSSDSTFNPAAQSGFIGDFVWFDLDSDGIQDIGEPGLENVQVNLHNGLSCDSPVVETTLTNTLGFYVFDGLPAGVYCVEVYTGTLPDNFTLTTSSNPLTTTLLPGGNDSTIDFGFSADDCLPDIGFEEDALGNPMFAGQIVDTEFAAYGVTISGTGGSNQAMVFDSSNPTGGDPDVGSPHEDFGGPGDGAGGAAGQPFENRIPLRNVLIVSEDGDTTDPDDNGGGGTFTFAFDRDMQMDEIGFLDNGDTVGVDGGEIRLLDSGGVQIGAAIVIPGVGDNGVTTVTSIGGSGVRSVEVELFGSGSIDTFITCGPPVRTASLGDRVWLDIDGDGVQDIGEPGIPNVEVTLYDAGPDLVVGGGDDVAVATALTDAAGLYLFTGLPASTFYVDVTDATVPSGLTISPGSTDPGALVTLAVGDTDLDSDFGYRNNTATAVIGDTVWADADGDGLLDGGEPGISGVTLDLISAGPDGILSTGDDVVEDTATTDADGRYLFTGVAPGKYLVDVTDTGGELTGYTLTVGPQSNLDPTLPILVEAGDVYLLADFGYDNASLFMIDDTAWLDLDRDGVLDPGEEGIPGVTVTLLDSAGDVVATDISDANGDFSFTGLENGDYTILITDTANELADFTTTTSPAAAGQQAVTIAGADVSGTNFGYARPGVIGDRVWSDADSDGVQDPNEVGISGVTVQILYDINNNGVLDVGTDTLVATAVTDAFGEYLFEQLFPGTYVVSIDDTQGALTGYTHTTLDSQPAAGDQLDSGLTTTIDSDLDNDFGYVNAALPNVSGNVFHDLDRDGFDDGVGEPGIGSVTIALVDSSGNIVARTSTDANGDYLFPDVPAGDYTVTVTDRDEVLDDYFLTSGLDAIDITVVATDITDIDFGYARRNELGRIGDFVWLDADRDGVQDQSEPGLSNVTLNLFDAGPDRAIGGGDDILVATTVTDANGGYIFADLPVGNYYVDVDGATVPSGLSATTGTTDPSRLVNLAAGEEDLDVDFGYGGTTNSSALGDRVWVDADSDGLQDPGEVGIEGVTVRAVGPAGSFTTTTGPDGLYLFTGLTAGTYTVTVDSTTLPSGLNTFPTNSPPSREFDVPADADILTADFGFDAPGGVLGTIGDTVFLDVNANGVQDGGEEGIEDVTLNLRDSSGDVIATLETDENGNYDFTGLLAGSYTVDVTDLRGVLVGLNLSAGSDPTGTIVLAAGQDFNDADFGYSASAMVGSLGNLVWHDVNGDGDVDAGESGLGGVTLDLWVDVDGNGSITLGVDNFLRTTTTDGNGEYEFRGLIPETYLVDVTDTNNVLAGYSKTTGAAGVDNNSQADPYQVTLTTGAPTNVTADFGYEASVPFTLSGTVFVDDNEDALFNGLEAGVTGVPVRLFNDLDGDGVLDPGEPQIGVTTSDGSGDYLFTNLPNGNYIVTVDTPDTPVEGFMQTTQTGTGGVQPATIAGANSVDNDFGFFDDSPAPVNPAAIGDRVWFDIDADGVQDIGEPGIANVTVRLFDVGLDGVVGGGDDVLLDTRITDFSGEYLFPGLDPGTYYVDVVDASVPTGLTLSPGSVDPTAAIVVVADQIFLDADFGYRNSDTANAIIGNFVWSDADNDGLQDPGEPGIGGVTVDLVGPGADGILGTGDDTVEDTQTTADDGTYLFTNVTPGEYRVDVTDTGTVLTGYTLTSGPQSNPDPTDPISVLANEVYLDADFGYVNGSLFSISDRTWHDIDGDGIQDPGEPAFENVTVSLVDASGDVIATDITDSNGDFSFDGLEPGNYRISITDTNGVLLEYVGTTAPATADQLGVTIVAADITGVNFGYNIPGQIGDTVWSDANGNDVQDPGEPGIPGVTVELWLDDGDGIFDNTVDTLVGSQVTNGAGFYLFEQLGQGTYFSSVDDGQAALSGYTPTTPDEEGGVNAPGTQDEVTLATSAASFLDADFGYQQPALPNVSGNVFSDLDRDGVDDGVVDVGIPGVTIDLVDSSGVVVATTTTDVNGDYSFLDVSAGDYTVTVTDTAGLLEDFFLTSGLDAIDITVVATDITDIDFGYARDSGTASIGDFVWLDADRDGVQDGSEPGIQGVNLELFDAGPDGAVGGGDDVSVGTTTTDGNGLYLFTGLAAGTYYVDVDGSTVPSGLSLTTGSTDPSSLISLSESEAYRLADFGYGSTAGSALGDFVWVDANSDGLQDPGEAGIEGVSLSVVGPAGTFMATTGPGGFYLVTGLTAGTYTVTVDSTTLPSGLNTFPTNSPPTREFEVPAGSDVLTADFGFDANGGVLGTIGDTVFLDADADGMQDVGEQGIADVTLDLLDASGDVVASLVTDENGNYDFTGLVSATYRVDVTDLNAVLAGLNLSAGTDPTANIVLAAGQDFNDADFGYTPSAQVGSLGNLVWHDVNGDGDVDPGESGLGQVTLNLWLDVNNNGTIDLGTDNFLRTETTDSNGEYEFRGLPVGNYLVDVTDTNSVLTGFNKTTGAVGVDDNSQADPYAVSLTTGAPTNVTADFGYEAAVPFNLSGTVFLDQNQNAILNAGEDEVSGIVLTLYRDLDGDGVLDVTDAQIGTAVSAGIGDYSFTNLPAGDYLVTVTTVDTSIEGFTQTTQTGTGGIQPATIVAADSTGNDFGFFDDSPSVIDPAAIGDRVWFDIDGDGVQDIGEPGIPNVTLELISTGLDGVVGGGDDISLDTALTDLNGEYLFSGLDAGTYYVNVINASVPPDLSISPGSVDPTAAITVVNGQIFLDADFGYRNGDPATAMIGNFVWSDADNDGFQDPGEPGINNVTLDLVGPGVDGILGTGDDVVVDSTTTDNDGGYLFTGVAPGEYRVDVTDTGAVLAGYTLTSGPQSNTDPTQPISVVADEVYLDADFGYVNGALFSISDRTWRDIDGDGTQDPGEPGIAGVTVSLLDGIGNVIATTVTDALGDFSFDGVDNGSYSLSITDNDGVLLPYVGTTVPAIDDILAVTVAGADVSGINFGYNVPGQIGDTVWSDANGNDVQDPGEPGIPGVTVELWLDDGDGIFDNTVDTLVGSQVTNGAGFYLFEELGQGTYFSSVDDGQAALSGYTPTTPDEEVGPNAPGTQDEVTLTTSAASFLDADFGYQQPALPDVSGNVFNDLDRDGVDDGVVDVGIEGVTIALVDSSGVVVATTTTDSNGDYSFLDVSAGDYTVTVTDVDGVLEDFFLTSGLDAIDITVVATDITDIDFGYARDSGTASIGDFVWLDGDDDGVQDGAEPGIGGVDLELFNAGPDGAIGGGDDVSIGTTTTDGNGLYLFEGLSAGTYYVDVIDATVPSGLGLSTGSTDPSSLISLSEGEDFREADFGYSGSGGSALGDFIWYDADSDGEQDPGEVGFAGITVELRDTNDVFITSDVTDSNGLYLFTGLAAATYRVVVLTAGLPAGVNIQPTNIGGTSLDVPIDGTTDFLFADWGFDGGTLGSIGDTVFLDTDGDGIQDVGEGGIEGVTLNLLDNMGNAIATAITDENGNYDFQGLLAGTYQVDVTDTGGVLSDLNLSAGSDPTAPIILAAGQDYDLADFPYTPSSGLGTIGNLVWRDTDNSGDVDAGESGVEGVTVDLWVDVNGDGAITPGIDNFLRTETTDENGEYEFNSLPEGDYLVTVIDDNNVLSGFTKTSGTAGLDNNSQADPYAVTLTSGAPNNLTADFGYFAPADLNISGTTFFDLDGDGLFEPSIAPDDQDFGVNETLVLLFRDLDGDGMLDPTDVLLDSMPSDGSGDYLFTNLPPGDYIVAVDATGTYVDGATQTTQLLTLSVQPVTLVAADSVDNDFGFNRPATAVFATRWRAFSSGGQVVVEWQTTGQANTLGFQLYRVDEATDREILISGPELLPALTTSPQGATYQVVDRLASSVGTHATYLLVETETSGFEQIYGPYTLRIDRAPGQSLLPTQVSDGFRSAAREPNLAMQQRLADHRQAVDSLTSSNDLTDTTGILGGLGKVSGDSAMQLLVRSTGLHQVTEQTLADGLQISLDEVRDAVRSGQLQITWRGLPVAWRALDEGGRGLVFFGESIDSLFTLDNVYRVTLETGVTMTEQVSTPVPPNAGGSFRDTLHLEEDVFAATFASRDPELDYWHWRGVFAGHPTLGSTVFDVEVPQVAPSVSGEQLNVYLVGASDTGVEGEHHVEVSVNGQLVGDTSWTGLTHHQAVFNLPNGLLLDGANQITVTGLLDSGAPQSLFYVDGFDVIYDRLYAAQNDTLLADVRSSEFSRTLQGFSGADIAVLDVSDSLQPVWQSGNLVEASGDTFDVTVELRRGSTQLWAGLLSELPEAVGKVDTPSDLLSSFNGAQYMVVAPTELLDGAQALADYRSAEFTTTVVDLADVMDTFNDGIYDPNALREFLAFVHSNWRVAPDYVVLLGTGNFDYRDLGGLGGNAMPPLMVGTPYGLYASDVRYADVSGDGQPEMSIGRLPVLSNDEVNDYLTKLEAHRASSSGSAPWVSRVLLAADDPDSGGNFSVESDLIDSLLPQVLSRQKVYLGETAVPDARQLMLDAFDDGMALVNYVGHGGLDSFAAEGLLTAADVPGMTNGGRLPLVVSLTCNVARFEVPGFTALGEELVLHSDGGAIAVIAPSGLSLDGEAHQLDQSMVEAAYGSNDLTVGQIHTRILEAYAREGNTYFVGQIYQLLGDPAAPFVRP